MVYRFTPFLSTAILNDNSSQGIVEQLVKGMHDEKFILLQLSLSVKELLKSVVVLYGERLVTH